MVVGVLTDDAVESYKLYPILPFDERKMLMENIRGIHKVIEQKTLSYRDVIKELNPDFVVHGDDWRIGFQKSVREEVVELLSEYGGRLVEYPYSRDTKYDEIEKLTRAKTLFGK